MVQQVWRATRRKRQRAKQVQGATGRQWGGAEQVWG